jgi:hypothetical protein
MEFVVEESMLEWFAGREGGIGRLTCVLSAEAFSPHETHYCLVVWWWSCSWIR